MNNVFNILDGDNNPIDEVEDAELDMEDLDSSMDMVARLFRMSINSGILCLPAVPTKVSTDTNLKCRGIHLGFFCIGLVFEWSV